jgi:hypothetical protein
MVSGRAGEQRTQIAGDEAGIFEIAEHEQVAGDAGCQRREPKGRTQSGPDQQGSDQ